MVFSSAVGVLAGEDGSKQYSVGELNFPTAGLEATSAFTDGLISSWEGYEQARTSRPAATARASQPRETREPSAPGLCTGR
jgi:hypothetical protein